MKFLLSLCVALVLLNLVTAYPSPRPAYRWMDDEAMKEVMKEVMKEAKQDKAEVAAAPLYVITNTTGT